MWLPLHLMVQNEVTGRIYDVDGTAKAICSNNTRARSVIASYWVEPRHNEKTCRQYLDKNYASDA